MHKVISCIRLVLCRLPSVAEIREELRDHASSGEEDYEGHQLR